ncbi:hypothetical protein M2337_002742 [Sphingobium sp. B2D3A]|uniref:hypothetical protein n=1 Tax=unclassified Sphingobium TaxID=2611147 RepID=UPI0022248346|nr:MULTISPECIES: hypothetical protein [unclassified Sphingobium]MCW2338509.1 hypothetical protein [Sphingobium sp. B2D3A]MCW2384967.1 hypothetical protein [Sphingobium sp. B2D3D]
MATIIRDPLVEDYIFELAVQTEDECAEVRRHYEAGDLILLRNVRFDLDYAFLNSLNFDVDGPPEFLRKIKKYGDNKIAALDEASAAPLDRFVFEKIFGSDSGKVGYYKEQVAKGNVQCDALYKKIFPEYSSYRQVKTWRFTSTLYENLHWDVFGIPEVFHQVRIFSNIAASPRLWRTSHRIEHYAESAYREFGLSEFADKPGDDLVRHLNSAALGGMKKACLDRLPKHHIAFEPGEVWLGETRKISHQIYHGERAFATMYFSDPASMDSPELLFDARIARLHARFGTAGPKKASLATG